MNIRNQVFKSFTKFCNDEKYNILDDISFSDNKDSLIVKIRVNKGRGKKEIDCKARYVIESKFWDSIKDTNYFKNTNYLIFKDYKTKKEYYLINPKITNEEINKLNRCNKSSLNEKQLLCIFERNNEKINDILIKRCGYDDELKKIILSNNVLQMYYLKFSL